MNPKINWLKTIQHSYVSAFQVLTGLPRLVGLTVAVLSAVSCWIAFLRDGRMSIMDLLVLFSGLQTIVTVPLQLGGYRLLLLGKTTKSWSSKTTEFFLLTVAESTGNFLAMLFLTVWVLISPTWGVVAIALVLAISSCFLYARLTLMLPALAIDARNASFRQIWDMSRGRVWSVLATITVTTFPVYVVLHFFPVSNPTEAFRNITLLDAVLYSMVCVSSNLLSIGALAALYRWLAPTPANQCADAAQLL